MANRAHLQESVAVGDVFQQVNPAPGFHAERWRVQRPAELDGWWWCEPQVAPRSEKRIPSDQLLNHRVYRREAP